MRDYFAFTATHGDKECLIDRDRRLSFTDVAKQVASLGAALAGKYGVAKGDRVAIAMRNSPEWCISFMAITSIGAVAVPMNSWWQGDELAYGLVLQLLQAKQIFAFLEFTLRDDLVWRKSGGILRSWSMSALLLLGGSVFATTR